MFIMIESNDIEKIIQNKSTEDNHTQFCKMRAQWSWALWSNRCV